MRPITTRLNTSEKRLYHEWAWALRTDQRQSLLDTVLQELSDYFGVPRDEALRRAELGDEKLKEEWLALDPRTPEEIADFYKASPTYIYELMYWHSCVNDSRPLLYVPSVRLAHAAGAIRYLDFGSGVGSQGLLFAKHGMETTLADIAPQMLDLCRWRFKRHGVAATFIDLNVESLPRDHYDFITAMEVLEHVPNPFETIRSLVTALRYGGMLYFSAPFREDSLRPMHVVTQPSALWAIRSLGLERVPARIPDPTFHVYRRVKRPQAVSNVLASLDHVTSNAFVDRLTHFGQRARNKLVYEWGRLQRKGQAEQQP